MAAQVFHRILPSEFQEGSGSAGEHPCRGGILSGKGADGVNYHDKVQFRSIDPSHILRHVEPLFMLTITVKGNNDATTVKFPIAFGFGRLYKHYRNRAESRCLLGNRTEHERPQTAPAMGAHYYHVNLQITYMVNDTDRHIPFRTLVHMGVHAYADGKGAGSHRTQIIPCIARSAQVPFAMDLPWRVLFYGVKQGYP